MEFKGTKGEWELSSDSLNSDYEKVTKSDFPVIAINVHGHNGHIMTFGDSNEEHIANAKLIAAAPELLKSCESLIDPLTGLVYDSIAKLMNPEQASEIEKAINKALN